MTHFMRDGNRFSVAPAGALDIREHLPLGTYKVGYNELSNTYYLETIEDFTVTGKIYGDTLTQRNRILHTFADRPGTTGVLLTGEKGSGKTLLAKLLSLSARASDVPTLVINMPYCGDTFNAFMQSISQPVVVIFDEFEKVYDSDAQQRLLTLLDGTYASKKLFVLTANNRFRVDEHMKNRPGRIFYRVDFTGVSVDFVREYCQDNLDRKDRIEDVAKTSRLFMNFNFDLLKALVEEMNRFDEGADEALEMLNAEPEKGDRRNYLLDVVKDGAPVPAEVLGNSREWFGNPLLEKINVFYYAPVAPGAGDEDDEELIDVNVDAAMLKRVDLETGDFVFENAEAKMKVTLVEQPAAGKINYRMVY